MFGLEASATRQLLAHAAMNVLLLAGAGGVAALPLLPYELPDGTSAATTFFAKPFALKLPRAGAGVEVLESGGEPGAMADAFPPDGSALLLL